MKRILILLAVILLIQNVAAQENEVCLVYFTTSSGCGDDCILTDSFMGGLSKEYSDVLLAITYDISIPENADVFEAYKYNYELPDNVPIVLFAPRDYLQGRSAIFGSTESRIVGFLDQNGSNCPLESGYLPPRSVNPGSLSGSPQVSGIEVEEEEETPDNNATGDQDQTTPENPFEDIASVIDDVVSSEEFPLWMVGVVATVIILIVALALVILFKRGKGSK